MLDAMGTVVNTANQVLTPVALRVPSERKT